MKILSRRTEYLRSPENFEPQKFSLQNDSLKLTNIKLFNKLTYPTNRLIYVKFLNYTLSRKLDKFLALVTLKMWSEAPGKKFLFGPRILQKLLNPKITSLTFELEIC